MHRPYPHRQKAGAVIYEFGPSEKAESDQTAASEAICHAYRSHAGSKLK